MIETPSNAYGLTTSEQFTAALPSSEYTKIALVTSNVAP
jgi:hypothetical protein